MRECLRTASSAPEQAEPERATRLVRWFIELRFSQHGQAPDALRAEQGRSDGARSSPKVAVQDEAGIEFRCGLTFDMSGKKRYPVFCPLDEAVRPHSERSTRDAALSEAKSGPPEIFVGARSGCTQRARPRRDFGLNALWRAQMPPNRPERAREGRARASDSVGALVHRAPVLTAGASTRCAPRRAGHSDGARCSPKVAVMVEADIEFWCGLTSDMSGKKLYPVFCPLDEAVGQHRAKHCGD